MGAGAYRYGTASSPNATLYFFIFYDQFSLCNQVLNAVFLSRDLCWAVGTAIFKGTNVTGSNANWDEQLITEAFNQTFYGVSFLNENTGWIVGTHGIILSTVDGGESWEQVASDVVPTSTLRGVQAVSEETVYAVGLAGTILKSNFSSGGWTLQDSAVSGALYGLYFVDRDVGVVVGEQGLLLHTSNGGHNWTRGTTGAGQYTNHTLRAVTFTNHTTGWVVGDQGILLRTHDMGYTWALQPHHCTSHTLHGVFLYPQDLPPAAEVLGSQSGWAVGEGGVICHTEDGGETWGLQDVHLGPGAEALHHVGAFTGFALNQGGTQEDPPSGPPIALGDAGTCKYAFVAPPPLLALLGGVMRS
eukprot:gene3608-4537_t